MVDMFFYRDPEEVEKQQQDDQAKANVVVESEAAPDRSEWDVNPAPQPGGINPALAQEGGGLDWSADPAGPTDWSAEPATGGNWDAQQGSGWD